MLDKFEEGTFHPVFSSFTQLFPETNGARHATPPPRRAAFHYSNHLMYFWRFWPVMAAGYLQNISVIARHILQNTILFYLSLSPCVWTRIEKYQNLLRYQNLKMH